ncbi:protein of unknown function [Cupriavidus sp. YR651]|uniref:DUF4178 domain-containing protein n=1 Tax=Cupriavidus sp. YR651 TaxID=1855315 RepID=UPI0008836FD5|nr:DUF4178 domain-containing protein [Cupriavidus sp. YR651]SDD16174.1 protein of unknown function [Cupriavidus sp. YR651]
MQTVNCPGCGAEVSFRSSAAVMAVCEYCHSTLLREADAVRSIGKMSSVLEDYTPLQLHASGVWQGQGFALVGRIQLRYDAGLWNEWYVLFDDGTDGWLADASGQYMLTRRMPPEAAATASVNPLPKFETLKPGDGLFFDKYRYEAGDVRTARCTGGEGELPFQVGAGWTAQVADFRNEGRFLTLDYADGYPPSVYTGELVTLAGLKCQLLRGADEIGRTADKYRGKAVPLGCPNCGSPIAYRAGMASFVVCPSCHSEVDCTTSTAIVLEKHAEVEALQTSLTPGEVGTIDGKPYTVLGLLQCIDDDEDEASTWVEYLLFNEEAGLLWLVEQDAGWDRVRVLDTWPRMSTAKTAAFEGKEFRQGFDYESRVLYAAGTFNWRVQAGDTTRLTEFGAPARRLTRETSETEIVWTLSTTVSRSQVAQWFKGNKALAEAARLSEARRAEAPTGDLAYCRKTAWGVAIVMWVLNLPLAFFNGRNFAGLFVGTLLLWAPVWIVEHYTGERKSGRDGDGGDGDSDGGGDGGGGD